VPPNLVAKSLRNPLLWLVAVSCAPAASPPGPGAPLPQAPAGAPVSQAEAPRPAAPSATPNGAFVAPAPSDTAEQTERAQRAAAEELRQRQWGKPASDRAAVAASPLVAVGELEMVFDECSNMGGLHAIYRLEDDATAQGKGRPRRAHGGGHAVSALPGISEGNYLGLAGGRAARGERWFVLGLSPTARRDEDHDGNPDSSISGWCLDRMPRADAEVLASIPVESRAAAEELVRELRR
jgi:hypothetical protein